MSEPLVGLSARPGLILAALSLLAACSNGSAATGYSTASAVVTGCDCNCKSPQPAGKQLININITEKNNGEAHVISQTQHTTNNTGGGTSPPPGGDVSGLATTYSFHFRNFTTRELTRITDAMESELPGFIRAGAPSGDTTNFTYGYVTRMAANRLYKSTNALLMKFGLYPDRQVKILVQGTDVEIDKLY